MKQGYKYCLKCFNVSIRQSWEKERHLLESKAQLRCECEHLKRLTQSKYTQVWVQVCPRESNEFVLALTYTLFWYLSNIDTHSPHLCLSLTVSLCLFPLLPSFLLFPSFPAQPSQRDRSGGFRDTLDRIITYKVKLETTRVLQVVQQVSFSFTWGFSWDS